MALFSLLPTLAAIVCSVTLAEGGQADTPETVLARFESRIASLLTEGRPALFAWHLRSVRALARAQFAELSLEQGSYLKRPLADHRKEFVDYLTTISKGFEGDCADPNTYLKDGTRTLVLSSNSGLGDDTELVIAPGAGHYPLPGDALDEQGAWMTKHVRKRPARFSFTVDQAIHPGVWGIRLPLNAWQNQLVKEPWPRFECS